LHVLLLYAAGHRSFGLWNGCPFPGDKDVQMLKAMDTLTRISKFLFCLAIAVIVVWRADHFSDPHCVSPLPSIMCCTFAVLITFTGLALANESKE